MIGLGGAEFRLPLLISLFGFPALEAVIMNKAMSLIVVAVSLPFRASTVPFSVLAAYWASIINLLAGSMVGAWIAASWATRLKSETLYKVIAVLLVAMAVVLLMTHGDAQASASPFSGAALVAAGIVAGFVIGVVAALMGVAGGELLIPTLILLFGADIKLAGSLSLAVSLPTMLTGFARYSRDQSFSVLARHGGLAVAMAAGSIIGAYIGAQLLGVIPGHILLPLLAVLLALSAIKVWQYKWQVHRDGGRSPMTPLTNRWISPCVKGSRMPAAQGRGGLLGRQASEKPQGRKPRAGKGTAVRRARSMGI